jgi:hypothetical protein
VAVVGGKRAEVNGEQRRLAFMALGLSRSAGLARGR